jgi:hypothetical protein
MKLMDTCEVMIYAKRKPLGYQGTKYKKSTKTAGEDNNTTPNAPIFLLFVLPDVINFINSVIKARKVIHIVYSNYNPTSEKSQTC